MFTDYFTLGEYKQARYLDNFRGEPAITNLDWTFTPNHRSSQNVATVTGTVLRLLLDLSMIRSISFGSNMSSFKPLSLRLLKIKLATHINSLAHYTKGTLSLKL